MKPDGREKAARAVTEICNIHICLELKQKGQVKFFLISFTNLLWTDYISVVSTKALGIRRC